MFEVYKKLSPPIICEILNRREINYELRNFAQFSVPYVKSLYHGTESISYLCSKIWEIVPNDIEELYLSIL